MIDFIRVHYRDKSRLEDFILNPENFEKIYSVFEYHSEEILYPFKSNLENMEIVVNEKSGYVKNSIHKLNNLLIEGIDHNHNDFNYSQLCSMIDFLNQNIIDISLNKITQLEFGLNIKLPIKAEGFISQNFLMQNFQRHTAIKKFKGRGYLLEFEHYNYIIKIYDKAKQYKISDQNILRFEIKFLSAKEFNPLGVFNINDLKNRDVLKNLFEYLLKRFDELLIVDEFTIEDTSVKDFEILNMYSSYSFWEKLKTQDKRQLKLIHKEKYFKLIEKYSLLKKKMHLRNELIKKFKQLMCN
jgi:hypothetical protein